MKFCVKSKTSSRKVLKNSYIIGIPFSQRRIDEQSWKPKPFFSIKLTKEFLCNSISKLKKDSWSKNILEHQPIDRAKNFRKALNPAKKKNCVGGAWRAQRTGDLAISRRYLRIKARRSKCNRVQCNRNESGGVRRWFLKNFRFWTFSCRIFCRNDYCNRKLLKRRFEFHFAHQNILCASFSFLRYILFADELGNVIIERILAGSRGRLLGARQP